MSTLQNLELTPGTVYSPADLREAFDKGWSGKGIAINYDDKDNQFIRLFSLPNSEYQDDLQADPMRYVGEKNFEDPAGDQVSTRGNKALIESQNTDTPIFLFEKVSKDPVEYYYHGRVEVIDYDHNYRPSKDKNVYDFYLKKQDQESNTNDGTDEPELEAEGEDDLVPSSTRKIDPTIAEGSSEEEVVSYLTDKEKQASADKRHEATVDRLARWLREANWECRETLETDILALRDNAVLVVEVKSITEENERQQLRKGLGQVFENSYRDVIRRGWGDKDVLPSIAFSQPPSDQYSGYLEFLQGLGIHVLWRNGNEINGHPTAIGRLSLSD